MPIVLVSSGHVARQFATDLSREYDVTVVHHGEEGRAELEKLDVEVLVSSGNDVEVLRRAGVDKANFLIACSTSDERNILACLISRRIGNARTICFVEKEEYVRTFAPREAAVRTGAPDLGIDHLVWPAQMLADRIGKILAVPGATNVEQFAHGQLSLLEYRLPQGTPLTDRPLADVRALPPGVLVVAVTRGEEWFVPRGQSVLQAGDRVHFMGRTEAMQQVTTDFNRRLGQLGGEEVVIIGGGAVGQRLAQSLEATTRVPLKLIEVDRLRCVDLASVLERTLVLHGDGCDIELLEAERVSEARAFVAVTDSDEKNLLASLLGRHIGIPKIITRVSSSANRRVFERVGIDVPLSARGAATEAVLHMIRHREVDLLATLGEGTGEVLEITLPADYTATPLKDLHLPQDAIMAAVVRHGDALVPGGATLIGPGDRCLVICLAERVEEVRRALLP